VHPSCGILSCCLRHGLEYCCQCGEFPCQKYDGVDGSDSFITHKHQRSDFERIKRIGLEAYQTELGAKVKILQDLLKNYNDGRRKSFFCVAVNLLELHDVAYVMERIAQETASVFGIKEKAAAAVRLFQAMADTRQVPLKLRKKRPGNR